MAKTLRKLNECLNCHETIKDSNYCSNCGQINTNKQVHLKHFFIDFLSDYFTFDSKFTNSFFPLFSKPGFLTNEYNNGKRISYILPLRLYFFTTIMFFIIISITDKLNSNNTLKEAPKDVSALSIDSLLIDDETVSAESRYKMVNLFSRKYSVKENDKRISNLPDTLSHYISMNYPELSMSSADFIGRNLYYRFTYYKKKKKRRTVPKTSGQMHTFLNQYQLTDSVKNGNLFKRISSRNRIAFDTFVDSTRVLFHSDSVNMYYPKISSSNWTIFNTAADSLEKGFYRDFVKKAEIISEMDQGAFKKEIVSQIPKVMFLILPLFALILKLIYVRQGIFYINHLIFSLHAHTILFLYILVPLVYEHWTTVVFCVFGIIIHMFMSLKNVYKQSKKWTMLKFFLLTSLYIIPLVFGFALLMVLSVVNY